MKNSKTIRKNQKINDYAYDGELERVDKKYIYLEKHIHPRLRKFTPEKLSYLLEDNILLSQAIMFILEEKKQTTKSNKWDIIHDRIEDVIEWFIHSLTIHANHNNILSGLMFSIALIATKHLMATEYKNTSKYFRNNMHWQYEIPVIISPWISASELKIKNDDIMKRIGLARDYPNSLKSRYNSVPTHIVLHIYQNYISMSDLKGNKIINEPLTSHTFNIWWNKMKKDCLSYFDYDHYQSLRVKYPEYYRSLRDDRGDKTPVYIKRKLWLQACKQALKVIANANARAADTSIK